MSRKLMKIFIPYDPEDVYLFGSQARREEAEFEKMGPQGNAFCRNDP